MTHMEILQKRASDATAAYTEAGTEAGNLTELIRGTVAAVDQVNTDYMNACRTIASNGSADVAEIRSSLLLLTDRLTGLQSLKKEADDKVTRLTAGYLDANRALEAAMDNEEMQRLKGVLKQTNQKVADARNALQEALQEDRTASGAVEQHRKLIERKERATA